MLDRAQRIGRDAQLHRAAEHIGLAVATPRDPHRRGGFVAIESARAEQLGTALRREGIYVDARGKMLRIGPAPYVTDEDIDTAMDVIARSGPE